MSGETNGLLVPDEIIMNKIYYIRDKKLCWTVISQNYTG